MTITLTVTGRPLDLDLYPIDLTLNMQAQNLETVGLDLDLG